MQANLTYEKFVNEVKLEEKILRSSPRRLTFPFFFKKHMAGITFWKVMPAIVGST